MAQLSITRTQLQQFHDTPLARGERALFVPRLEVEHAQSQTDVERVDWYLEYPDIPLVNPHA